MNSDKSSLFAGVEWFYTYFLIRDLVYLSGGGMLISIWNYTLYNDLFLPIGLNFELIIFLFSSYFIGVIITNLSLSFKIFQLKKPGNYTSFIIAYKDMENKYSSAALNQLERLNYHRLIGVSFGTSFLFGGILISVVELYRKTPLTDYHYRVAVLLFILAILSFILGYGFTKVYSKEREEMLMNFDEIKKK